MRFSVLRLELVVGALTTTTSSVPPEAHVMVAAVDAMDNEQGAIYIN